MISYKHEMMYRKLENNNYRMLNDIIFSEDYVEVYYVKDDEEICRIRKEFDGSREDAQRAIDEAREECIEIANRHFINRLSRNIDGDKLDMKLKMMVYQKIETMKSIEVAFKFVGIDNSSGEQVLKDRSPNPNGNLRMEIVKEQGQHFNVGDEIEITIHNKSK